MQQKVKKPCDPTNFPVGKGYRKLKKHEILQEDDEFRTSHTCKDWHTTLLPGSTVEHAGSRYIDGVETFISTYRRRVT